MTAPLPDGVLGTLRLLVILSAIVLHGPPTRAATESQRRDHLSWMLKNLPDTPAWRDWQSKSGTLPPDFDALPSANFLPDPFLFHDGRGVKMPADRLQLDEPDDYQRLPEATQTRAIEWLTKNLSAP